ncbi:MAG: patatin-like phospholipase family protein [Gemmatimonadetes bacterium]|nr:patatin-like phospholipase family protein [Gemmatimonadota bacterium]
MERQEESRRSFLMFGHFQKGLLQPGGTGSTRHSGEAMLRLRRQDGGSGAAGLELGGVSLGNRPWLVLGGGGLRGLAHIGAWRVLSAAGLRPAGIIGTSIGGLIGACIAADRPLEEMEADARNLRREDIAKLQRRAVWMKGIRAPALFRAETLKRHLSRVLPDGDWGKLVIRFQTNALELGTGRTEWFGIGARTDVSMVDAVYASAALPLFYPPISLPGGMYVDGGSEDALPIGRAAELGASVIIAIDVGGAERADPRAIVSQGMLAIHERVFGIMSGNRRRRSVQQWEGPPLLYIRPDVERFGTLDFDHTEEILEMGRDAAERVLGGAPVSPRPGPAL